MSSETKEDLRYWQLAYYLSQMLHESSTIARLNGPGGGLDYEELQAREQHKKALDRAGASFVTALERCRGGEEEKK